MSELKIGADQVNLVPELSRRDLPSLAEVMNPILPKMIHYCVGFMFTPPEEDLTRVVLIRKEKPEWQKGLLNGVGGKIEEGETPIQAMIREFEEEAGLRTWEGDWHQFMTLEALNPQVSSRAVVNFFVGHLPFDCLKQTRTVEREAISVLPVDMLDIRGEGGLRTVPNLRWIIPMALGLGRYRVNQFLVTEVA